MISMILLVDFGPMLLSLYRFAIAWLFLLLWWVISRIFHKPPTSLRVNRNDLKIILFCGVFGVGLCFIFYNLGLYYSTATSTAFLFNVNPLFYVLTVTLILRMENVEKGEILGMIIGFIGASLVIFNGTPLAVLFGSTYFLGNIFALLSAFLWSTYTIAVVNLTKKYGAVRANLWVLGLGTVAIMFLTQLQNSLLPPMIEPIRIVLLIFLGVVNTGIAFITYSKGMALRASISSIVLLNLTPLYTMIFAYLLLGESLTIYVIIGGLLIILGMSIVYFPSLRDSRQQLAN